MPALQLEAKEPARSLTTRRPTSSTKATRSKLRLKLTNPPSRINKMDKPSSLGRAPPTMTTMALSQASLVRCRTDLYHVLVPVSAIGVTLFQSNFSLRLRTMNSLTLEFSSSENSTSLAMDYIDSAIHYLSMASRVSTLTRNLY
jgi:hypothetical protein